MDEAIKTADLHHRDHLAAQREASELRDAASKRGILNGKVGELQQQVEELQKQLLESQNRWSRSNDDVKTYMEIAQTRQKRIDELTAELKTTESLVRSDGQHESNEMIMKTLSKDLSELRAQYDEKLDELTRRDGHVAQLQAIIDDWDEWYQGYLRTEAQDEDDEEWMKEDAKKTTFSETVTEIETPKNSGNLPEREGQEGR